ncbi:hypothetical protein [Streptomyces chartreusis]|uniref:hypothetical protein n=1 Tax=Streptomyces chartreusis TaxID=1969 RepID=UPI003F53EB69
MKKSRIPFQFHFLIRKRLPRPGPAAGNCRYIAGGTTLVDLMRETVERPENPGRGGIGTALPEHTVTDHVGNALGVQGLGEVVRVGVVAAIGNAVLNATGRRVRQLHGGGPPPLARRACSC